MEVQQNIEDSKLYLSGGKIKQKGGALGSLVSQLIPVGLQLVQKIFVGKRKRKRKRRKIIY